MQRCRVCGLIFSWSSTHDCKGKPKSKCEHVWQRVGATYHCASCPAKGYRLNTTVLPYKCAKTLYTKTGKRRCSEEATSVCPGDRSANRCREHAVKEAV